MHKEEITELFRRLLQQAGAVDIAEAEFKRMIGEDESLRNEYREWCHMVGSSERKGFTDFCEEYLDSQDSIWNVLNDFDE